MELLFESWSKMGPLHPISPGRLVHDGAKADPTPIRWGDAVWESVVSPVLDALQADLDRTVRGGQVFALVVRAWKDGTAIGSNKEVGDALGWEVGDVAEGFRLVRERLKGWRDPVLEARVKEYTRELIVTPRGGVRANGDMLLSVGGGRPDVAGRAMAGATPVAKSRGMRLLCEQPADGEEQAQVLGAGGYAGYLILPVDETDDFGAMARLGGRAAVLDIATRKGGLPCVTFDYAGAGLYCAQQLMELGCTDVVMITRQNDSRTYSMGEGYRRAVRRAEGPMHRMLTVDGNVVETLCALQERGLLVREGRKLGLLCADGELGEDVLRYLDSVEAGSWDIAVAVVGGKRWGARHWAELIWVELDYAELAAAGARYLTGALGAAIPQVRPRYERWVPRKAAGNAAELEEEIWRPVMAS
jgi:DNA-binding LacI/PurR family transcriptional regulator